jgi:hypothetical protein
MPFAKHMSSAGDTAAEVSIASRYLQITTGLRDRRIGTLHQVDDVHLLPWCSAGAPICDRQIALQTCKHDADYSFGAGLIIDDAAEVLQRVSGVDTLAAAGVSTSVFTLCWLKNLTSFEAYLSHGFWHAALLNRNFTPPKKQRTFHN